jgi:hypothetical protein
MDADALLVDERPLWPFLPQSSPRTVRTIGQSNVLKYRWLEGCLSCAVQSSGMYLHELPAVVSLRSALTNRFHERKSRTSYVSSERHDHCAMDERW